jgi:hypothetical protein
MRRILPLFYRFKGILLKCSSDQEMLTEQLERDCRGCYNEATITEERIGQLEAENATLQEQLALEQ